MGDKISYLTLFVYKKHHGHLGVDFDSFWLTKPRKKTTVKIHSLGDHAASYRQKGWDFIYLKSIFVIKESLQKWV